MGSLRRAPGDRRWCENVTVTFGNSGDTAATWGRVEFTTHVVDLLGIDWASYRTSFAVPVPIAPGGRVTRTYGICLTAWQVLPGTRLRTTGAVLER